MADPNYQIIFIVIGNIKNKAKFINIDHGLKYFIKKNFQNMIA